MQACAAIDDAQRVESERIFGRERCGSVRRPDGGVAPKQGHLTARLLGKYIRTLWTERQGTVEQVNRLCVIRMVCRQNTQQVERPRLARIVLQRSHAICMAHVCAKNTTPEE